MAEGFIAADYVTSIRLSEVKGKKLWLVRVPRHIDPARLEVSNGQPSRVCVHTRANELLLVYGSRGGAALQWSGLVQGYH